MSAIVAGIVTIVCFLLALLIFKREIADLVSRLGDRENVALRIAGVASLEASGKTLRQPAGTVKRVIVEVADRLLTGKEPISKGSDERLLDFAIWVFGRGATFGASTMLNRKAVRKVLKASEMGAFRPPRFGQQKIIASYFARVGILEKRDDGYHTTDLGLLCGVLSEYFDRDLPDA
ncbi:MAG: hypothetical protein V2A58_00110 [Planctomycetota bacterium]